MIDTSTLDKIIVGRVEPHIYAFTTNTVPNYLKVGDTYRPVSMRLDEWRKYYPELRKQYDDKAKVAEDVYFRDYSIHRFLETKKGRRRLQPHDIDKDTYYSNEFFKNAAADDVKEAIFDITADYEKKTNKYQFYNAENRLPETFTFARTEDYPPRPNQDTTIKAFMHAYNNGRTNLLMYAVMRFGKSFTSVCCAVQMKADFVVIVSAKADVLLEWKKTVESHVLFSNYDFITSTDLQHDEKVIPNKLNSGRKVVAFLTLQDLQGDIIKDKHQQVFGRRVDLLIIDETHFGARATKYGAVLRGEKDVKEKGDKEEAFTLDDVGEEVKAINAHVKLHLSGTPYRILMGGEFSKEDIIAFYQFTDIVKDQKAWDEKYILSDDQPEWDNPYYGFPQMVRFAFNPNESSRRRMKELRDGGSTYAFSALFKPKSIKRADDGSHKKFMYEQEILALLEVIDGSKEDSELLGFLDYEKIKTGKMCRHIVCVLPYCASCDALEALIHDNAGKFINLNEYEIVNISGVDRPREFKTPSEIKNRIRECEDAGKKTITLTVNRMLTGSTVEQWDTMLFLKDTASAQDYDQAIFRLQNHYIKSYVNDDGKKIKYNMKPQTLLVDFDPNRVFQMQEQKAQIYNVNVDETGNSKLAERIAEELSISPIIVLNKDKMEQIQAADILKAVSEYSRSRGVAEETQDIPVDLSLMGFDAIREAIERENELGSKAGLTIKGAEGEGQDMDIPEGGNEEHEPEESDHEAPDEAETAAANGQTENAKDPAKQFRSYYARILFFAFLTKNIVNSLDSIIGCINEPDNTRIADNIGIKKATLESIQANADKFMLRALDYKIQNLNQLSHDTSLVGTERAAVAVQKFGKLGESEVITPRYICNDMVALLPEGSLQAVLTSGHKILDIAGKAGEFALAIYDRYTQLGIATGLLKDVIYTVPTSGLTFEFTRMVYEILGLNTDCIAAKFTSYSLLNVKKHGIRDMDYDRIRLLLSQDKPFSEIALTEEVVEGDEKVKFDAVVGNPPYQDNRQGNSTTTLPIYHYFIEIALTVGKVVEVITPARFLFNAGRTPKTWNKRMLNDTHFKVEWYEQNADKIFEGTDIKGGVAISCYDHSHEFGAIKTFTASPEMNSILEKAKKAIKTDSSVASIVFVATKFNTRNLFVDYPEYIGHERRLSSNTLKFSCFHDEKKVEDDISIYGVLQGQRQTKYIERKYIDLSDTHIDQFKIVLPKADGNGAFGDALTHPEILCPGTGFTHTFFGIGGFSENHEAEALLKYIKTKFTRALLGVLKVTQDNNKDKWEYVPLQNFSKLSDVDWTVSIEGIDKQLYVKYGLTEKEIAFIEATIKPME